LRVLGRPALVGAKCADSDRDSLLTPLVRLGLPVLWRGGSSTAAFSFRYEGDRRVMVVDALGDPWTTADLHGLERTGWVHVGALARSDFPAGTLAALARDRRLSFDGQGLVRVPEIGPLRLDDDFDREILRHIWVLKLADEEAEVLGDPAALGVREVLVTHGSRGSTIYYGGKIEDVPARPVGTDPTGAGDAYATAYIVARNAGFSPAGAARRATAVVASMLSR